MPCLVCAWDEAVTPALLAAVEELRTNGEAVVFCTHTATAAPRFIPVGSAGALQSALDDEQIPVIATNGEPPVWLDGADCTRVLVVLAAAAGFAGQAHWTGWPGRAQLPASAEARIGALFAAGCEAVELLAPDEVAELGQSWLSGRRTGIRLTAS